MISRFCLGVCFISLCGFTSAQEVKEEAWIDLFNGEDLTGWERKGGEARYEVQDGAIVGTSVPNTQNSFLCTEQHYKDFILELEYLGHPRLNSGVQFRSQSVPEHMNGRVHGYQYELEDEAKDRDWSGGIYDEGRRGWLLPAKGDEAAGKAFGEQGKALWKNGEWNHVRIETRGDKIRTWLNGEPRAELEDNMTLEGFIGLQVHGVGANPTPMSVMWRNIRIQILE